MDLATIIGILTAISLFLGIAAIVYKFFKLVLNVARSLHDREQRQDAKIEKQSGQIKDLFRITDIQRQKIAELQGYCGKSKKEIAPRPFFPSAALEILDQSAVDSYKANKTDFTAPNENQQRL